MSILQQAIQLLSQPPGSIVYHLVTLLTVQAVLGLALWQWRRQPADTFARRLTWAAAGVLLGRLVISIAVLQLTDPEQASAILPPLEQAIDSASAVLLVWALAPHLPALPRLADVVLLLLLLFVGFMYAFFAQDWAEKVAAGSAFRGYASAPQAGVWAIFQMVVLLIGCLALLLGRPRQWILRLLALAILLAAHLAYFSTLFGDIAPETDIAVWVRLGNLVAFPLLAGLAYRHNLFRLLSDRGAAHPTTQDAGRYLDVARRAIESLRLDDALQHVVTMCADLVNAGFVALAITSPEDSEHLQLVGARSPDVGDEPGGGLRRQEKWALKLSDWPGIRLAMQQRQRVELIPDGLGARQLSDLYRELGVAGLGAVLIEPLLVDDGEIGVLLLANHPGTDRWPDDDKELARAVAGYAARIVQNARRYETALSQSYPAGAADDTVVSGRIVALEEERDRALAEIESLTGRWRHAEGRLAAEIERSEQLAHSRETVQSGKSDPRIKALEEEILALRDSLKQAEEAVALAAAGEGGLSPEWVTLAITRYSGELEEAQARINQLELRLAQQGDAQVAELFGSMTQELRTPLTSIAGYTDLLLGETMGILGAKQLGLLRRVKANIEHMKTLLDQLIQLSRSAATTSDAAAEVDVREAIESAVNAVSSQLRQKSLRLDMDLDDELPAVQAGGEAFYQIVAHLLKNACQVSTVNGHLLVSCHHDSIREVSLEGVEQGPGFVHLNVTDAGGGLSQEIQGLILDAHRDTADESALKRLAEVGDNLSRAVSLVAAHGGRIWVSSQPDVGSTLSVLLPASANGVTGRPDH